MDNIKVLIAEAKGNLIEENKGKLYLQVINQVEKALIENVLEHTEGNKLKAAKILGINRNTLHVKIMKLGINPARYKQ